MRIIKKGKDKIFYATCPYCISDIEYILDEVERIYDDGFYQTTGIICPCCKEPITADFTEVINNVSKV